MTINLETHPVWNEFEGLLTQIDAQSLVQEHLEACQYRLEGYWADDAFYDEINFSRSLEATLDSSSLRTISNGYQKVHLIKFNFILSQNDEEFGKLSLLFNSKMEFVDEDWSIDVDSPFVVTKPDIVR